MFNQSYVTVSCQASALAEALSAVDDGVNALRESADALSDIPPPNEDCDDVDDVDDFDQSHVDTMLSVAANLTPRQRLTIFNAADRDGDGTLNQVCVGLVVMTMCASPDCYGNVGLNSLEHSSDGVQPHGRRSREDKFPFLTE